MVARPRTETIMQRNYRGNLYEQKQKTGLPIALKLYGQVSTPEENGALLALLRATSRLPFALSERIEAALNGRHGRGWLRLKPIKLKGLPGVTFVWT